MTKYVPKKLTQLSANESAAIDIINQNLDSIKEHIDDALSRTAKSPSQMQAPLDMNGQKILNLGMPTQDTDVVRLKDVVENKEEIKQLVNTASIAVEKAMEAAETAEEAAEDMSDQIQLAKDWATKTDGPVADNEYSSKYYAEQIGADVHTVADIAEDVTDVASNATNINTVASDMSNVNSVAEDLANIDAVVSNETNVNTVATSISDVNDCATNMAAIQAAPTAAENAASSATAAQEAALSITNGYDLLDHKWSDHLLNDQNWLRADTFSWQDGTVYTEAYNHLIDDATNGTSQTETIAGHTITYTLADDGHKIVSDADASAVEGLYNDDGVAWYYILDLVNHRFKLPRTKYGIVGLRDTVGKYVPESVPNIKGKFSSYDTNPASVDGCIEIGSSVGGNLNTQITQFTVKQINASRSSSAYQDSAPVQQRATQMYLYFYVGQFTQTATEQTAGLNSELFNGKADVDLSNAAPNASASAKETIVGWGMPDYSAGVSVSENNTFTPTKDGVIEYKVYVSTGSIACFYIHETDVSGRKLSGLANAASGYIHLAQQIQVVKGKTYYVQSSSATADYISFYPYKGA